MADARRAQSVALHRWPKVVPSPRRPHAREAWDTEWSLRHVLRVLRGVILEQTMTFTSPGEADPMESVRQLEAYLDPAV